jgi:methionyl aminopeptidase
MIKTRNDYELKLMQKSGEITAKALKKALAAVKPGANLLEIEKVAADEIIHLGAKLSFPTVGGYKWATCLTVNEELVHGIPRDYVLQMGDVFSIDIGALYKGWHTDAAWSVLVGESEDPNIGKSDGKKKFLATGEEALWKAIKQAKAGNKIGDISEEIQSTVEAAGYDVSQTLVGHGVGKQLHEDPIVPGLGKKNTGPSLKKDMTIAIEVIYAAGKADVELASDGWTYVMKDKSLGGLFEMSVIVGEKGAEVLTDWRKA